MIGGGDGLKVKDCDEMDRGAVEGEEPDGEGLGEGDVERVGALVEYGRVDVRNCVGGEEAVPFVDG